ncbi:cytochrome P450 [Aspergillus ellipticus CBS 707.79]|uniref:Cytochrome P450 n=1 Tax=Aspergillus ellipticus CBS 707.79 TaxID=1448320 RepID=A0A319DE54_9EURO|nr:cytochrome P450 [Aspergillus ellipticus CBS 707.79]
MPFPDTVAGDVLVVGCLLLATVALQLLRIAPNLVSISDPNALATIYVSNGGFPKDGRYRNFDVNGAATIFSALDKRDKSYRDVRAKAVLPLFSSVTIRAGTQSQDVQRHVAKFVARFNEEKARALQSGAGALYRVDVLDLALRLSMDVMTGYMFDKPYGALDEDAKPVGRSQSPKFSESPWLQAIAAFGYYSMLPNWLFSFVLSIHTSLWDPARGASLGRVDEFVQSRVTEEQRTPANSTSHTYHGRLRAAGATKNEVIGISEGSLFAGTSSTGQTLATILFHLVRQPIVRERLAQELQQTDSCDLLAIPFLQAVITEGLRLAMTKPAPLTWKVPPGACLIDGVYLPGGVSAGASIHVMHPDPDAFPEPFAFRPERWLEGSDKGSRDMFIGRNLALEELYTAVAATVQSGVLEGAVTCQERIIVNGCFNGEVKGHAIDINWDKDII